MTRRSSLFVARRLGLRLVLFIAGAGTATPAFPDWNALADLQRSGAAVSAAALDLDDGKMLERLNPATRLTPASLTKLVVAAAALETWPADRAFQTRLLAVGPFKDGRIDGDLFLQGVGDATLDHLSLWSLAAQLKGAGVNAVSGRLVISTAPFGALGCETKDRCQALNRSDTAYNAPLAALAVDYGNWCVALRPTALGAPAVVTGCGLGRLPIPVLGEIRTAGASAKPTYWVERVTDASGDSLRVGGELPQGAGVTLYRAMSDPPLGTGLVLAETLREIGIRVDGAVSVSHSPVPAIAYPLAQSEGLSLKEQLGRMLRYSNNYVADELTLNLAAARTPRAPAQLADAARVLSDFVAAVERRRLAADPPAPRLYSGSGLTPENELSAQDLVALLAEQYRNTRNFPAFYGGLVVPRQAPFAFLRNGSPAWLDRVALKTGTMDDPHSVCGVAGYLRKKEGGWIAFAAIVNGTPRRRHVPLYQAMQALRSDIDALLARY
jgi:D-alanyl-D-alanine carboxypeptidase/D-alanyl-D-alanine-endopeptidase (penicillin-binding protein 4)